MSNDFYTKSGNPGPNSPGSSTTIRAEFELIQDGFEKMPTITGNATKPIRVNAAGTALEASSAQSGLAITSSTVNSTPIGATTPSTGAFTTLSASGSATIGGTATVAGALSAASATFPSGVTADITGDVTSTGTSSFQNIELSGSFTSNGIVVTAPVWVSGTTYSIGEVRVSPIDWQSYRRITAGAGTTDPSLDTTNWAIVTNNMPVITVTGTSESALVNRHYVLTNVSSTTVTLPASPSEGDTLAVTPANSLTTNVIARNGLTIMNLAEDMMLDSLNVTVILRYIASSWRFV